MKLTFVLLFLTAAFISCNDNKPETTYVPLGDVLTKSAPTPQNANTPNSSAPAQSGSVALNPEHGQPGHRCELAVGAPLPTTATQPQPQTAPAAVATAPQQISVTPAAPQQTSVKTTGLNPAHGQPGHRCDIAVGAPLNSKPQAQTPAITTIATAAKVAPGMNPAHGEPGHRCDIAVGSPLNQATDKKVDNAVQQVKLTTIEKDSVKS